VEFFREWTLGSSFRGRKLPSAYTEKEVNEQGLPVVSFKYTNIRYRDLNEADFKVPGTELAK